jgi:hypothetical protein
MMSSIILATTNCTSEYVIYKKINKTENTFYSIKFHESVPFMSGLPFIYRLKLYALFIIEKTETSIYRQGFAILHFKTGLAYNICSDCPQFELIVVSLKLREC